MLRYKTVLPHLCALACMIAGIIGAYGQVIIPKPLQPGSKIALVTPASAIKTDVIDTACIRLRERGYEPVIFPYAAYHAYGSFPVEDQFRAADLMAAFTDPEIDAIICTRGGYGTIRLLPMLNIEMIRNHPKWLVGFSDISDVHALMHKAGVASIHGPMAGHLAKEPVTLEATEYLFKALTNQFPMKIKRAPHPYNKEGTAKGRLVGGNLICINGLSETPYDVLNIGDQEPVILFIEEVGEQIYAVERMLMRLHYSGALSKLQGLIVGQMTDYRPDDDFNTMEDMIHYWLNKWGYYDPENPLTIVFDFPTGHVTENYPMIVSAETELWVNPEGTTLTYTGN